MKQPRLLLVIALCAILTHAREPIPKRVEKLLSQMTVTEKIEQLWCLHDLPTTFPIPAAGQIKFTGMRVREPTPELYLEARNELQAATMQLSRLNIPMSFGQHNWYASIPGACGCCLRSEEIEACCAKGVWCFRCRWHTLKRGIERW